MTLGTLIHPYSIMYCRLSRDGVLQFISLFIRIHYSFVFTIHTYSLFIRIHYSYVFTIHSHSLFILYYALCTIHYALCITMHYALCTMYYYALCTLHYALCTMYLYVFIRIYYFIRIHTYLLFDMEIRRNPVILVLTRSSCRVE